MTSAAGEHPRWLDPLSQSLAALPAPPKGGALFVPTFRKQAPPSGELANAVSLRGLASSQQNRQVLTEGVRSPSKCRQFAKKLQFFLEKGGFPIDSLVIIGV